VEKAVSIIIEAYKVSYAFYKTEKGEQILGTDKYNYMKITQELGYRDYGVHIEDGGRYNELRQRMRAYIEFGMNSKEISALDALRFEMEETFVGAERVFQSAIERTQKVAAEQQAREQEFQAAENEKALAQGLEIANADREDRQESTINQIVTKGQVQMEVDDNTAKNKVIENTNKQQNDLLKE
jgi:hypothetical protein